MSYKASWTKSIARILLILTILYVVALVVIFFAQRRFLYFPRTSAINSMLEEAQKEGLAPWRNGKNEIIGWKRSSQTNAPHKCALIVHGNAGCAVDRAHYATALQQTGVWDVYILEYPGYGARPGSPSRETLCQAADEAIVLLEKEAPVFVIGESIGTGVATYLTHSKGVAGLLLIAPYDDLAEVAQLHMPIFPVHKILKDRFIPINDLSHYKGPVAVLLAGRDEVVPNQFGRKLYESYEGPKKVWLIQDASHNSVGNQPVSWWQDLIAFWQNPYESPTLRQAQFRTQ